MQHLQLKRARSCGRLRPFFAGMALALACAAPGAGRAATTELLFSSTAVFAGERGSTFLQSVTDFSFQGFSCSAVYDPAVLRVLEVTMRDTIAEALRADFFEANLFAEQGWFNVGCLIDAVPPFDERMIPGLGIPLALTQVVFQVPAGTPPQVTRVRFVDGLGTPPIFNVLSVENLSLRPDLLTEGLVGILSRRHFIRGDANQDAGVDVADPVFLINFLFHDRAPPPCKDAGDANDDESLDLADAIFILQYYFMKGLKPPPPFPSPGPDPTAGRRELGCLESAF